MDQALQAIFTALQLLSTNVLLTHREGFAIDVETTPVRHGWAYPRNGVYAQANAFGRYGSQTENLPPRQTPALDGSDTSLVGDDLPIV